ncbi:MAG TPA: 50S ribosomal protein L4 [Bacilli bacterium]|nr:50S ribosomal protein L4 [Bacilli bacterium]
MLSIALLKQTGEKIGDIQLNPEIFGIEDNQQVIYEVIKAERAGMRQGTQKAKTRAEVRGGGRKPWRQKGTGRARQGSIRSPQWRGGGVVFAPTPRSHSIKVNKKVVRLAMRCALSSKLRENAMFVLDEIVLDNFKTKSLVEVLNNVQATGKILVVSNEVNPNVELAGRNIPNVSIQTVGHISVYDMMNASSLVITKDAIARYEEVLK